MKQLGKLGPVAGRACLMGVLLLFCGAEGSLRAEAGRISGVVTDERGAAIPEAQLQLSGLRGVAARARSDAEGVFRIEGVAQGKYTLRADAPGFQSAAQEIDSNAGGAEGLTLTLKVGAVSTSVTVNAEQGYAPAASSTGGRMDMKLIEIPQTVQVVSRQLLEDRQVVALKEAVRSTSGVYVGSLHGGQQPFLTFRGFSGTDQMRDGIREYFGYYTMEMSNVERVEVLKGPASVLFGHLEPGGVINVTTKQPSVDHLANVQLDGGSFGFWRPSLDMSGPVNRAKTILYRLGASYTTEDGFRDFTFLRRTFLAPTLLWRPTDRTSFTLNYEQLNERSSYEFGSVALGDRPAPIPISRSLNEPFNRASSMNYRGRLRADHVFGNGWVWRTIAQKQYARYYRDPSPSGTALNAASRVLTRTINKGDFANPGVHFQSDLGGFATTGSFRHAWVAGGDIFARTSLYKGFVPVPYAPINIFAPVYNQQPIPSLTALSFYNDPQEQFGGFFFQDQVTWGRLQVLAGLRVNLYQRDFTNRVNGQKILTENQNIAPRLGLSYRVANNVMAYASWAKSFVPVAGNTFDGVPFVPTTGEQIEAGFKAELLNRRLFLSTSVFSLTKSNVSAPDPVNPGFSIQVGSQRTRGFEGEMRGSLTRDWSVAAGYSFFNGRVVEDLVFRSGALLPNTPRHGGNLWTTYDFSRGKVRGLGLSAGFYGATQRQGDLLNSFQAPGFATLDAGLSYRVFRNERVRSRFQLQVTNLTNRVYYEGLGSRFSLFPGAPRSARGTVQFMF